VVARRERLMSEVAVTCAGAAVVVGLLVLIGWAGDVAVLKSVVPGLATMKVNTALSFILSGLSLLVLVVGSHGPSRPRRAIGLVSASVVLATTLLTLAQYAFSIDLGIDQFFFQDSASVATAFPGRMAPITALVLLLIGLALLLLHVRRFPLLAQIIATVALLVATLCCLSYLYGVHSLQSVTPFSSVAVHTAAAFLIVSLGVLAASPPIGVVGLLVSDGVGGSLARRLLPAVVVVPVVLGWLRLVGQQVGWYGTEFGIAVFAVSTITVLAALVAWTASQIQKADVERRGSDAALRASEERFRAFMDHTPAQVWIDDEDGVNRFANPALARELRRPVEEIIGRPLKELMPGTNLPEYLDSDRRVIESGKPFQAIVSAPRHDGEVGRFLIHKFPLRPSADGRRQVGGVAIDVTERERAVEALRASEERLRLLIEGVKDYAIYTIDTTGTIETWNTGAARLYSYTAAEIIGQHRTRLFTAEDVASGLPRHELELAASSGKASEEGWRVRKDGSRFWANGTMNALYDEAGGVRGFVKVVRDLTERKRAEAELRASEERFRSLVTAISQIVWTTDATGDNHVTTPTWAEYTGLPEEEVRGWGWVKAVHPDDRERAAARWRHSLETREQFETDYRILRADGEWRHFIVRGVPLLDGDGAVWEWVGVCEDDTVRRQAEEGMRLRDRAIQAVSQGILITDSTLTDNPIIYASRGFEGITGYTNDGVLGRNCRFLQGQDTDPATVRVMHEAILAGRECAVEVLNYKQDGTPFWNALFMTPVRDDQGKLIHFVGVQADVTERRGLERALQQSQKMEAVGRLAGGVAHDFNNLLTIICGYSDLLLMEMPPTNPQRGLVVEIRQAGERAAGLTRQLLAFSRKEVIQPVVLDLNDVVAQTEKMLRRLLGEDIAIAAVLSPTLPRVKADPGQVDQVVMNLCVNARDAMPTGGRLTIETIEVVLEEEQSAYPDLTPGRYAQLSVTDTGHGMTETVKAQIFEPFFTTKEPGKGTGLGLATVFGIVKQSNGRISVYSEVGVGTTFKILFPAVDGAPPRAPDNRPGHPLRGTETILLVEDEEGVRKIARVSLETQGYKVLEAVGGTDAIRKAEQHPGPIELVLTDVVMPEMSGRQLADTLRVRYPGVKVLFMSGYTDDAVIRHGIIEQTGNFLQKPFAPLGLAKKVRAVLDEKE